MSNARILIVYYSATGSVYRLAEAIAEGAGAAGAAVRLRRVAELAPEDAVQSNPDWAAHRDATTHIEEATLDDLEWANGYALGTPTRYGTPSSQLKQFLDSAGSLWNEGRLSNKVATSFVSSAEHHGGQESTILGLNNLLYHWGTLIVPPGYTDDCVYEAGGNPYGVSWGAGYPSKMPDEITLASARYQGRRLATFADIVATGLERAAGADERAA